MSDDGCPPIFTAEQCDELRRLSDLLEALKSLQDRGLVPSATVEIVGAEQAPRRAEITRLGEGAGALRRARQLASQDPQAADGWSERARTLVPEDLEAWTFAVDLACRVGDFDRAVDLCRTGADQQGHDTLRDRIGGLEAEARRHEGSRILASRWQEARAALAGGNFENAIQKARQVQALDPDQGASLDLLVDAYERSGRLSEAVAVLAAAICARPSLWSQARKQRLDDLRSLLQADRQATPLVPRELVWVNPGPELAPAEAVWAAQVPSFRWREVAGEFFEDHWQKLILGLAVLLIVVSSTVGAALVLGDRLWRAEGKCLLALAYMALFAAFGRGLWRWGAERAGRIVCLTTLVVLPVNFALVGDLPILERSQASGLAVLALSVGVLGALGWWLGQVLRLPGGRITILSLLALGAIDALTPHEVPFAWGFAALLGSSGLFLAAVEWLHRSLNLDTSKETTNEQKRISVEAPYDALGLLTFSFLWTVVRIGGSVLHLPPTLYAVPVMLAALAAIRMAEGLRSIRADRRPVLALRFAGFVLSALAFALALARPLEPSALYSGNTLMTAVLGLALYSRSLWRERAPAYLYAGFAALFLAYFGGYDFLRDLIATVEGAASRALGYRGRLPFAFKALNGLVFSTALAVLSRVFARRWNDPRLARHCHYIGLPLAVAACLLGSSEPTAALMVFAGYTVLFAAGAWWFEAPWVVYLCCVAFAGAAAAGSTFLGDLTGGVRALALASVALAFWVSCRVLKFWNVRDAYRRPIVHAARAVSAVALVLATWAALPPSPVSWTVTTAFWMLALLNLLISRESPRLSIAYASTACAALAALLTTPLLASWVGHPIGDAWLAGTAGILAATFCWAGAWRRLDRGLVSGEVRGIGRLYATSLTDVGLLLAGLDLALAVWRLLGPGLTAWEWAGLTLGQFPLDSLPQQPALTAWEWAGLTLGLSAMALALARTATVTRRSEYVWAAYPAVLAGASGLVALVLTCLVVTGRPISARLVALAWSGSGLAVACLGEAIRGMSGSRRATFGAPVLVGSLVVLGVAGFVMLLAPARYADLALVLVIATAAFTLLTRQTPERAIPHLALSSALGAWICGDAVLRGDRLPSMPAVGALALGFVVAVLALREVLLRVVPVRGAETEQPSMRRSFATALPDFLLILTIGSLLPVPTGFRLGAFSLLSLDLGLAALAWLGLTRLRREALLVYLGQGCVWLAALCGCQALLLRGDAAPTLDAILGGLSLASALVSSGFVGLRALGRRWGWTDFHCGPMRSMALATAAATVPLVLVARWLSIDAFAICLSATLLLGLSLIGSALLERCPGRASGAIGVLVLASYLVLFEVGRGRPGELRALGVLASVLALACWGLERAISTVLADRWRAVFAWPLLGWSLLLSIVAIPCDWGSPGPLLLAALPFLLLIKSVPRVQWLYVMLAILTSSAYFQVLQSLGASRLIVSAVVLAYLYVVLALAVRAALPVLCRRFQLPQLPFDRPWFHATLILGVAALALRAHDIAWNGGPWYAQAWLPFSLAALCWLMRIPHPGRGWIHGFVGLTSFGLCALCGPVLNSVMTWILAMAVIGALWRLVAWGILQVPGFYLVSSLGPGRVASMFDRWSLLLSVVAATPLGLLIGFMTLFASLGIDIGTSQPQDWWHGLLALLLLGVIADSWRREVGPWFGALHLHAITTLLLWWLVLPSSPLIQPGGFEPQVLLPLVTALQALALSLGDLGAARLGLRRPWAAPGYAVLGAIVATVLTWGRVGPFTTVTLMIATLAVALVTASRRRATTAAIGSVLWILAWVAVSRDMARDHGWVQDPEWLACLAAGQLIAAVVTLVLSRRLARLGDRLAEILDSFGTAGGVLVMALVGISMSEGQSFTPELALVDLGLLAVVGVVFSLLAQRRQSVALAYAAQASVLVGYLAYRMGFPAPGLSDATVVLLLAALDLGLAEILDRFGRPLFSRPALGAASVLPTLALVLAIRAGSTTDQSLLVFCGTATFYAIVCGRTGWRPFGYASAVLYNAFLWLFWARAGWEFASDPQFYLIPVGLTSILFAEAHRRELGRPVVNAIRGVGLALIYVSLTVPIWREASLAAWAILLLVSLVGIFVGIGLRSQVFLWLGLAGFVLDVGYQLGRIGLEHALAKWAIMLALGIALILFVAFSEKKRWVSSMKGYVERIRQWE